jgi:hypothetical protein
MQYVVGTPRAAHVEPKYAGDAGEGQAEQGHRSIQVGTCGRVTMMAIVDQPAVATGAYQILYAGLVVFVTATP